MKTKLFLLKVHYKREFTLKRFIKLNIHDFNYIYIYGLVYILGFFNKIFDINFG